LRDHNATSASVRQSHTPSSRNVLFPDNRDWAPRLVFTCQSPVFSSQSRAERKPKGVAEGEERGVCEGVSQNGTKAQNIGRERQARPLLQAQSDGASLSRGEFARSATQGAPLGASLPPVLVPAHIREGSGRQNARTFRPAIRRRETESTSCLGWFRAFETLGAAGLEPNETISLRKREFQRCFPYRAGSEASISACLRALLGGSYLRYAICAIAFTGVRNASSISTATPSPVIVSLVGRFMIKPSSEFEGVSVIVSGKWRNWGFYLAAGPPPSLRRRAISTRLASATLRPRSRACWRREGGLPAYAKALRVLR
jgi:hypothetical protein